jgi:hypothetical protein
MYEPGECNLKEFSKERNKFSEYKIHWFQKDRVLEL